MMRKTCFTVNPYRTYEEIKSYESLFKDNLFQGIEIFYPYMKDESFILEYEKGIKEIINSDTEVVLHLPHGPANDLTNTSESQIIIARFKEAIDFGKRFKATKYTLHLGGVKYASRDNLIEYVAGAVKDLADYAYPSLIMIENMPASTELGYSIKELKLIFDKINKDNVKFIFDFGHANVAYKESNDKIEDYFEAFKDKLVHLHISDNDSTRDAHSYIGSGNINYKYLFSKLNEYNDLYCFEILYNTVEDLKKYYKDFIDCL